MGRGGQRGGRGRVTAWQRVALNVAILRVNIKVPGESFTGAQRLAFLAGNKEQEKRGKKGRRRSRKKAGRQEKSSKENRGRSKGGGRASEAKAAGGNDFAFMATQEAAGGKP